MREDETHSEKQVQPVVLYRYIGNGNNAPAALGDAHEELYPTLVLDSASNNITTTNTNTLLYAQTPRGLSCEKMVSPGPESLMEGA